MDKKFITKITILLLCIAMMTTLVACRQQGGEETTKEIETVEATLIDMEPLNPAQELEFFVDANLENSISLTMPAHLANKYHTKIANSFAEGWFKLTVCLGGENMSPEYNLFTIYGYKYPEQNEYATEKNYANIACDGIYSYIWFEYDHSDINNEQIKQEIENFERQYENIKDSICAIHEVKAQAEQSN